MHILIADDHPIICVALTEMVRSVRPHAPTRVDSVGDGDSLLQALKGRSFDLLVLDLHMPGRQKSVALLEAVVARRPALPIMVYTGVTHPSLALAAQDLGVMGYVLKASGPDVALYAMEQVLTGAYFMDPHVDIDSARDHPWHQLTAGERQVILALARGKNLQAIALDSQRSYKTVTAHKYNALHKLGLRSNAEIVPYLAAHGLDYLLA